MCVRKVVTLLRNTPTGVGKTVRSNSLLCFLQKHPHGRGENKPPIFQAVVKLETPPRAWGKPFCGFRVYATHRNTPTGVGKTTDEFIGALVA